MMPVAANNMEQYAEYIDLFGTEFVAAVIGMALAITVAWVWGARRRWKDARRLETGDSSDDIVISLNHVVSGRTGAPVLLLRPLAGNTDVNTVFRTNTAAEQLVMKLARNTTSKDPLLAFRGERGMQAAHAIFNHVLDKNSLSPFGLKNVVLAVTCEEKTHLKRAHIRVFVMERGALQKFEDSAYCALVRVSQPSHAPRVIALHQWAKSFHEEENRNDGALKLTKTGVQLGIRDDWTAVTEFPIDWTKEPTNAAMTAAGVNFVEPAHATS